MNKVFFFIAILNIIFTLLILVFILFIHRDTHFLVEQYENAEVVIEYIEE